MQKLRYCMLGGDEGGNEVGEGRVTKLALGKSFKFLNEVTEFGAFILNDGSKLELLHSVQYLKYCTRSQSVSVMSFNLHYTVLRLLNIVLSVLSFDFIANCGCERLDVTSLFISKV